MIFIIFFALVFTATFILWKYIHLKYDVYEYTEKLDIASAARKLKSPNIKTRKRALKAIHDLAKQKKASR